MSILSEKFLENYKNKTVPWGFGALSYVTYKRTYSRVTDMSGRHLTPDEIDEHERLGIPTRTEEWWETLRRCFEGAEEIKAGYTQEEAERLYDYMFNLKCSFGGRFLWQLGTQTVRDLGMPSLLNCFFVAVRKPEDFCFIFEHLMLGCGVGFSVRRSDINELPKVKKAVQVTHELTKDADFIVPDSRAGWVNLLRIVLDSYFKTGKSFSYSTILVRPKGAKIRGFGGTASGPEILVEGIKKISAVLQTREGKKLRSVDVLDIANIIGSVVVAGNVRRSAEIALGDADDLLFLRAKRWDLGNIPNHRAMSNNTIYADSYGYLTPEFWEGYNGNGEPYGMVNLGLAQTQGRLGDFIQDVAEGANPCAEIFLESYEPCCLAEVFLNNVQNQSELEDICVLLHKTLKATTQLPSIYKETEEVTKRNARTAIGVTGIAQSYDKLAWLDSTYLALENFDEKWSKLRGWNKSIKLTTVKPSGTLSLLAGATPGIHPAYAQYYIRRVRIASTSPLVEYCKSLGYVVEFVQGFDGTFDYGTSVVEFPVYVGENAILARDMTAIKQLELVKQLQTIWSDNAVSVTVYYRKEELEEIKSWLEKNYETGIKSCSFLLHSEHGFSQAPYEEIDADRFNSILKNIGSGEFLEGRIEDLSDDECATGVCPIR